MEKKVKNVRPETLTLILVNLAGIMERADEALLPGVYKEVGTELHTDPTGLGTLTLFRSIVQCSCYPLAVLLSARYSRTLVIALGAFLWSAATFLVAISSTFTQVAISRGLNGIGLAIVAPAIQSLVADSTDDSNRGTAFGWLQLTGNFGSIIGGLCSVLLASTSILGIPGWRVAFHLVGLISVIVGILVGIFADDPHFSNRDDARKNEGQKVTLKEEIMELMKKVKSVMRIQTFQLLIAQGVSGSFPWSSLSFAPMWLELIGFSHKKTALLWTLFIVACSVGGLFGGKLGDILARWFPNSGRIFLSQISSASAIPLGAILLLALSDDPSTPLLHGLVLILMGLTISWNGPATINPIFAEIVPARSRTSIYALDRSFESILSSFAPPVVGFLSQHVYGYKPVRKGATFSQEIETDRENGAALAKALYTAIGFPMAICCFFYSFLYYTYPRDRERARRVALEDKDMEQVDTENRTSKEEYAHLHIPELDELHKEGISVITMEYEGVELVVSDKHDRKRLLPEEHPFSDAS